jgi:hypothetical protein
VLKWRESEFDVGFGVADTKDVVMEVALQTTSCGQVCCTRPRLRRIDGDILLKVRADG